VLFETGPGNAWLLAPWARRAPHPRGGSYAVEIYRRLPNDTDFSVFRRRNIPGLNFAVIGDSYAYHTARDTPERISTRTLQTAGENIVAIVDDLQTRDITQRSPAEPTYFDIGGTVGVSYGPMLSWLSALAALLLGMVAWLRMAAHAFRIDGVGRWLVGALWAVLSAAAVAGAMIGCTWLLRAAREVYHPWYARPDRLFALLLVAGVTVGWSMARAGQWLPARAHGPRHPAIIWSLVLPIWIGLAGATAWAAPAASYLWVLPLLTAGVLLSVVPPASSVAVRAASIVVLAVAAALWLRESVELLRFVVAVMGRLTMVTPVFVYAAVMSAPAIMIVPPLLAGFVTARSVPAPTLFTALLLIATAAAAGFAYAAPAYTYEQPQRRHVRAIQEGDAGTAIWEVASLEPGLDLAPEAPGHWSPVADAPAASIPLGRLVLPFVFRSTGPGLGPAPVAVAGYTVNPLADGVELSVSVVPREPGVAVSFVLPAGLTPARSNLPGVVRRGRWTATFVAPPPEGVAFRASFGPAQAAQIRDVRVAARLRWFPSGGGPQRLPAWLPQDRAVWSAAATWVLPAEPPIAPVPPLR
jgi:hypothetical protein